ncbi:MAG TPA: class I SAM-dependent methyltransferase [Pyrinomonadaceae bacterium]|nr:class I SAM-dependent methyltransferase [Pyrinomonadaceae bacterium]
MVYVLVILSLLCIVAYLVNLLLAQNLAPPNVAQLAVLLLFLALGLFFYKHPYLLYLIILAVPVKISLLLKRFQPAESFQEIHTNALRDFLERGERLQVLDISTGRCNSLYRHGWMTLDADYTGLDLSETMLLQGQKFMTEKQVPIDFVLGDAARLPFQVEMFDIVLNYGAINGFTNPKLALEEMARVTKKGGLVLFLDEQLYEAATFVERFYFKKVLSSHNIIHRCPVELIPASLGEIQVHQVYHFYYICTCYKR